MSITSEINRINTNIENAYSKISEKGGVLPQEQNSSNLVASINSIKEGYDLSDLLVSVDNINKEFFNQYSEYYKQLVASYSANTDEPLNIYVPNKDYTYYAIVRGYSGNYRVIYFKNNSPRLFKAASGSNYLFAMRLSAYAEGSGRDIVYNNGFKYGGTQTKTSSSDVSSQDAVYYSGNYSLSTIISKMTTSLSAQSLTYNNTCFELYNSNVANSIIYTNAPILYEPGTQWEDYFLTDLTKLSSNETYITPNN